MKMTEKSKLYRELKIKMKAASKLKPKTWNDPAFLPFLMVGMRQGQSSLSRNIHELTTEELSGDSSKANLQNISAAKSMLDRWNTKSGVASTKIIKGIVEIMSQGRLFDFTLKIRYNDGKKTSFQQMIWHGHCQHFLGKPHLTDEKHLERDSPPHADAKLHKYLRLAIAASYYQGLGHFVEVISLHFHPDGEKDENSFHFCPYTLFFKARNEKTEKGQVYAVSLLEVKWDLLLDNERADFYRFRRSVTTEIINKVSNSSPGRLLLISGRKSPVPDVDLVSPQFEFPAMLSIAIYNYKMGGTLTFDRVLSGSEMHEAGEILYSLVIQAQDKNKVYHINAKLQKKPSHLEISSFDMVQQGGAETAAVDSIDDENRSVRRTRSGRECPKYFVFLPGSENWRKMLLSKVTDRREIFKSYYPSGGGNEFQNCLLFIVLPFSSRKFMRIMKTWFTIDE